VFRFKCIHILFQISTLITLKNRMCTFQRIHGSTFLNSWFKLLFYEAFYNATLQVPIDLNHTMSNFLFSIKTYALRQGTCPNSAENPYEILSNQ
jgi:hypothetical protein